MRASTGPGRENVKNPKVIAGLVVALLFVIFLFQNVEKVPLQFFFWQWSMPKIILISLAIVVGFVTGFALAKIKGRPRNLSTGKGPEPTVPGKEQGTPRRTS